MLNCGYQCHLVGGPYISENPDCPFHGAGSADRETSIEEIIERAIAGEVTVGEAASLIMDEF